MDYTKTPVKLTANERDIRQRLMVDIDNLPKDCQEREELFREGMEFVIAHTPVLRNKLIKADLSNLTFSLLK